MQGKLPYYMVYPLPLAYDDGRIDERDMEYMKSLYPDAAKRILPYVEEECDRMEYQHSMIYDEFPDQLQLRMMCSRVYDKVRKNEKIFFGTGYDAMMPEERADVEGQQRDEDEMQRFGGGRPSRPEPPRPPRPPQPPRPGQPDWLRDLIEVMLYQELMRRRRQERRDRSRFY